MGKLGRGGGKKTMLMLTIKDKVVPHNIYMHFIRNGGLFMLKKTDYELGDDAFILLKIMDGAEKIPVEGEVIWVAKKGVKRPHSPGVGIQFTDPDNVAKDKIETYLAGSLVSTSQTATM